MGEALPNYLAQQVYEQSTYNQVFNLYGPTEDTTYSTFAVVEEDSSEAPPIGRPIDNTLVYVLDANLQPVPIGVPGELYIGGDGLARGYLNRPDLTEQKFIHNPFSTEPDARLYRTGDLVCYRPNGSLDFLRRIDQQVKIRGFRIELEEIETVLNQHPAVQESVVIVWEDRPGDKNIVGYVVARSGQSPMASELRSSISDKLPKFMIPSAIVLLEALPQTPNGKVDRSALPSPKQTRHQEERAFKSPRTPIEAALVTIWESTLGLDDVGIDENFFELGGHSLKAIELLSRIETTMNVEVALTTLFESPTIASLAARIGEESPTIASLAARIGEESLHLPPGIIRIQKGRPDYTPIFLIPGIAGYVMYFWHLGTSLGSHPVFAIQGAGLDGEVDFFLGIEEIAAYYITNIRKMQPHGPYMLIGKSSGGVIGLEITKQLELLNESVTLGLLDSSPPSSYQGYQFGIRATIETIFAQFSPEIAETTNQMSEEEMVEYCFQRGRELGIIPENWHLENWRRSLEFGTLQSEALAAYSHHPSFVQAPIYLFRAAEEVSQDYDEWSNCTRSSLHTVYVPGNHVTLTDPPNATHLAKAIIMAFGLS